MKDQNLCFAIWKGPLVGPFSFSGEAETVRGLFPGRILAPFLGI